MAIDQIIVVLLGALAGGFVAGLAGFGTGLTALGIWLYVLAPQVAASLVIICSVASQLQTLPGIWHAIDRHRLLPFVIPGLLGVPLGLGLLAHLDPGPFRIGVGLFLLSYAAVMLFARAGQPGTLGRRGADSVIGLISGILGGLAGLAGVLLPAWTDTRGWRKDERRAVLQGFNLSVLSAALLAHAMAGLLTAEVGMATLAALPGTASGAWLGAKAYRRLSDRRYREVILALLGVSGCVLVWTSI